MTPAGQARPHPVLSPGDQLSPYRVSLDVAQDRDQVVIALDRERLNRPCKRGRWSRSAGDTGGRGPSAATASTVRGPRLLWPQDQMEVIGHQAIAQDVDRQPVPGVNHRLDERGIILVLVEHRLPAVAPIQGVIPDPTDRRSCGSRHDTSVNQARRQVNKARRPPVSCRGGKSIKRYVPLCRPLSCAMSPCVLLFPPTT